MAFPRIDRKRCTNCGSCIDICPVGVYGKENGNVVVKKAEECLGCRACEIQCPAKAIKVEE